jgi:phosphoenolpyruvate-protein phosphotransferase
VSAELRGMPAAPGVASGAPWIYRPPAVDGTTTRMSLADAADAASMELEALASRLRDEGRPDEAEILDAQALMAGDETLLGSARERQAAGAGPAAAVSAAGNEIAAAFEALDDPIPSVRAADVRDVAARIARHVAGAASPRLERRSIVVAEDLAPSVTVELDRALLAGIALQGGSRTSHAAILARALGIPAVVCIPNILDRSESAVELAIDGDAGVAVLDPDEGDRDRLAHAAALAAGQRSADEAFRHGPLETADGHRVHCVANIGHPDEAEPALGGGAEGIGLFRTEFAFAGRATAPTEDEQVDAYLRVLRAAGNRPVVFRLADIGGDKPLPYVRIASEANPFLGVRGLRLVDAEPELYPTQLRAILRASGAAERPASIMAPMVADGADVAAFRQLVDEARAAIADAPAPRIGIMVEIPSAVLLAEQLGDLVDFMSIGTNDLTQYLLAADRTNSSLAGRQDPLHPAVLRAIDGVVAGGRGRCAVAVCGEMAGDPVGALLLVGMGVDELSMDPTAFGPVKRAIRERSLADLADLARRAVQMSSASEVRAMVGAT